MVTGCTQTVPQYGFKEDKDMYAEPFEPALLFSDEFGNGFHILTNAKSKAERELEKLRHENDTYKKVHLQMEERIKTLDSICIMLTDQLKTQRGTIENLNSIINSNLQASATVPKVLNFDKGKEIIKTEGRKLASETGVDVSSPETRESTIIQSSPIVLRSRKNIKSRLTCISSKKKNKITNADHENTDFDLDFRQLGTIDLDLKSDRKKYTLYLENHNPEVLNKMLQCNRENIFGSSLKQVLNTVDRNIIRNDYLPENKKRKVEETEKPKPKTTWNLIRTSEPTNNKKLNQTVLFRAVAEKKVEISLLKDFKGDFITSEKKFKTFVRDKENEHCFQSEGSVFNEKKSEANIVSYGNGNNIIFQPTLTSTATNHVIDVSRIQTKLENSFGIIPNTSPKYVYKRDAVRKKLERRKLPGQGCDKCMKLYEQFKADGFSDSEVAEMMNKCSKHRYKFPIQSNTPPGLWNPVFTDDDSL